MTTCRYRGRGPCEQEFGHEGPHDWERDPLVALLTDVVDWMLFTAGVGLPDWKGPHMPADLARRLGAVLPPASASDDQEGRA